ncbi:MAG: DUF72 domain-containing protein [Armatimonadota bacterium]|nr:DUF72 domain-containing protein [Armatimonadota bacterium]
MIYIGTSGFSYDDWKGHFYPADLPKKDMLAYYSSRFNCVEINSTFYVIPSPRTFVSLDRRTPRDFHFTVKAHKDMTHAEAVDRTIFENFLQAVQPVRESGKLGCVLAQFPWSFRRSVENIDKLKSFRDMLADVPVVVEFRNSEWIKEDTFDLLRELDLGFCAVDEPKLKGLLPPVAEATSAIGYVRFHGRNAARWWQHEESHERYDYLYTEDELREWVPRIQLIASKTERTYVFFNNHFQGKSVRNAQMLARMLNLSLPLDSDLLESS